MTSSTNCSNSVNAINEAIAGSIAGVITDTVFYAVDSFKVQKQAGSIKASNIPQLFRGLPSNLLIGSIPTYSSFFIFYQPIKSYVDPITENQALSVLIASVSSSVPSSLVYVPADVIKKRLVLGINSTANSAARNILKDAGWKGFFIGWQANLMKDVPFAGFKMSLYEGVARIYLRYTKGKEIAEKLGAEALSSTEAAIVGFGAGCVTSVITTPLDNVNTRMKSGELANFSLIKAHIEIVKRSGVSGLFRGLVPRTATIGFGSTLFWYLFTYSKEFIS
jgi:hypothetical protein